MVLSSQGQRPSLVAAGSSRELAGRYVYCVAGCGEQVSLGAIGIEGREVYTVAHDGLCAVVHDCPAQPYESRHAEVAAPWVLAHHLVVEAARGRWGTVLPSTFNTIIKAGEGTSADENLVAWLEAEHEPLIRKLEALAGKEEYGVQVFWDAALVTRRIAESSPEIRKLEEEIRSKPPGLAYMYRQRLDRLLRGEVEARASEEFRSWYDGLSPLVDYLRVDKVKKGEPGLEMLMNLSCLVSPERLPGLKAELDRLSHREGLSFRLVGPLPPYSFC